MGEASNGLFPSPKIKSDTEMMKILSSQEFINEWMTTAAKVGDVRFCKLTDMKFCSLRKFFVGYFKKIADVDGKLYDGWNSYGFDTYHKKHFGEWEPLYKVCGGDYEFVSTDKGDKYVLSFDDRHKIDVYPVIEGKDKPADYIATNPSFPYLMFVIYDGNNKVRLERLAKMFDINDYNYGPNKRHAPLMKEEDIYKMFDQYTVNWNIDGKCRATLARCEKLVNEYKEYENDIEAKRRYSANKRIFSLNIVYSRNGQVLAEEAKDVKTCIYDLRHDGSKHIDTEMLRKLFAFKMRGDVEDAIAANIRPDMSGMTNKDNVIVNHSRYTARNLPKDKYELIDEYRNPDGEVCEHCGKEHIVNVMVIENPKGEVFYVGKECVKNLVDIPEEEFNEWNQPFVDAINAVGAWNNDKKAGFEQHWFIYGDNAYYVSYDRPLDEYDFLCTDKTYIHASKEPVKGKFKCKEYTGVHNITGGESVNFTGTEFAKKMLPVYYRKAIVIDHNIKDIVDAVTKSKSADWTKFMYDGTEYDISNLAFEIRNLVPWENTAKTSYTLNSGILNVIATTTNDDCTELMNWKIMLGDYEISLSFTCEQLKEIPNPFLNNKA